MKKVIIYTTDYCPYCVKAKRLLDLKNVPYEEIDVTHNEALRDEMMEKAQGRRTVPQIFIDGQSIGGCDDLHQLEKDGQLDSFL